MFNLRRYPTRLAPTTTPVISGLLNAVVLDQICQTAAMIHVALSWQHALLQRKRAGAGQRGKLKEMSMRDAATDDRNDVGTNIRWLSSGNLPKLAGSARRMQSDWPSDARGVVRMAMTRTR